MVSKQSNQSQKSLGGIILRVVQCLLNENHQSSEYDSGSTIMAAVSNLFVQYEFAELSTLPPTELRHMLHKLTDKFDLGSIADSNEALDAILSRIHDEASPRCPGPPKCLAHKVFGGCVMEQVECRVCRATSEPELKDNCMHLIYVSELLEAARNDPSSSIPFGNLLRSCMCVASNRCPALITSNSQPAAAAAAAAASQAMNHRGPMRPTCGIDSATMKAYVLEPSLALALPLVWSQGRETAEVINELLSVISYSILASELFYEFGDSLTTPIPTTTTTAATTTANRSNGGILTGSGSGRGGHRSYVFRGMVCYYGKHYVSIFQEYSPGEPRFLLFDDSRIRCLGNWADVKVECGRSLYQPVLLLYELEGVGERERELVGGEGMTAPAAAMTVRVADSRTAAQEKTIQPSSIDISSLGCKHDNKHDNKHDSKHDFKHDISIAPKNDLDVLDIDVDVDADAAAVHGATSSSVFSPYRSRTSSTDVMNTYAALDRQVRRLHSSHSFRSLDDVPGPSTNAVVDDYVVVQSDVGDGVYAPEEADSKSYSQPRPSDMVSKGIKAEPTRSEATSVTPATPATPAPATSSYASRTPVAATWVGATAAPNIVMQRIRECKLKGAVMDVVLGATTERRRFVGGNQRPSLLGIEIGCDEASRILITGLYRHPLTHEMLPAERCGQIGLMDQLLSVNGRPLAGKSPQQVNEILSSSRLPVRLTIRSASIMNLICKCPYCDSDIIVSNDKWKVNIPFKLEIAIF